jgi:uracil-DNA glycosylase
MPFQNLKQVAKRHSPSPNPSREGRGTYPSRPADDAQLANLLKQVRACTHCAEHLPLGPNPVLRMSVKAKLLVIGQAPGTRVHKTGIPWNDPSGDLLRTWMGVTSSEFYDENNVALMGMGFCYPGKGASGDLPPREECAPLWHEKIRAFLPDIKLTLLIGSYALVGYLKERRKATLVETVKAWKDYRADGFIPLVHPSPRNRLWLRRNPWFEKEVVPMLREEVRQIISGFESKKIPLPLREGLGEGYKKP